MSPDLAMLAEKQQYKVVVRDVSDPWAPRFEASVAECAAGRFA